MAMGVLSGASAAALKIGYSDWPGWVAWQVAIDKGWFKEEGVEVEFEWFDYVPSMDAFSAGKIDGVGMTNGDALVVGATGGKSVIILINDYSNGNDMVIAKPGIKSIPDLKGKKVGLEVGFVSHLLLLNALEKAGMKEADVTLVNTKTNETPQVLASGDVDAVTTWQPSSAQALKLVPGSTAIYTSKDEPGLIYDVLAVNPASLANRRAEWLKVLKVWDRVVENLREGRRVQFHLRLDPDRRRLQHQVRGLQGEAGRRQLPRPLAHHRACTLTASRLGAGKGAWCDP
jgi:NitT/TauT family transport system substrate-binding protein